MIKCDLLKDVSDSTTCTLLTSVTEPKSVQPLWISKGIVGAYEYLQADEIAVRKTL